MAHRDNRADAFQQLVGDGLREGWGLRVSVAPTKGRDGAIDAFVEEGDGSAALADLTAPQIIECKDHDDQLPGVQANVGAGWSRVAKNLTRQAGLGWPGAFQPWRRARSYVYCVSAVLANQQERDKLQSAIRTCFEALTADQRPPIEAIRILDWGDLRHWLDTLPRVADGWLGTSLPLVPSHGEYCASLTGFRRYLRADVLPFIAPEEGANTQPEAILSRLEALAGSGGVLLKGVGGVGKTRTALEVGHRAEAKGWRVLHALPGEPGVTVEEIGEVLLSGSAPTLLVFDYLDQMPNLDLGSLLGRLLPEAQRRGIRLALLANMRPAALRQGNGARETLFKKENWLSLEPSAQQKLQINDSVLDRLAPRAVGLLGKERVRELCGTRPILALFIAVELERRALAGSLAWAIGANMRGGDLLGWLRRRLVEDKLVVEEGMDFLPPEPSPQLIAAAAMLAAAPLVREAMVEVGRTASREAGGTEDRLAEKTLAGLLQLGWLEDIGQELVAAHDVVADEVLAQVLWDQVDDNLREWVLPWCLAPARGCARVLGRYATALSRLLGAEETKADAALGAVANQWLRKEAAGLGQALAATEASESAYALGALVSLPIWAGESVANWHPLVAPWLASHGLHLAARHLLYKGLRSIPSNAAPDLLDAAMTWCARYLDLTLASYGLGPLLGRDDLEGHAAKAIDLALGWLERFHQAEEARYVIPFLLGRTELGDREPEAIDFALSWLECFQQAPEAGFVLRPLLERTDLGEQAPQAIERALGWLESFQQAPEADFVLHPLLKRQDLGEQAPQAIERALGWLESFQQAPEAGFVLRPLLERKDLGEQAPKLIERALGWLESFQQAPEADFVLHPLLKRQDLGEQAPKLIERALGWLANFQQAPEARFVLQPLLERTDLGVQAPQAIERALGWLLNFQQAPEAGFVLRPLLEHKVLGEQAPQAIERALGWLLNFQQAPEARFVLQPLLQRNELGEQAPQAIQRALGWLECFQRAPEARFVLQPLLERTDLGVQAPQAIERALGWLLNFQQAPEVGFVLRPLLEHKVLGEQAPQAIERALGWLENFQQSPKARFVLQPLLKRQDLGEQAPQAMERALGWLECFQQAPEARFVLQPLLERNDLGGHELMLIQLALIWLARFHKTYEASFVLQHLMGLADSGKQVDQVFEFSLAWLEIFHQKNSAQFVFMALLGCADHRVNAPKVIGFAINWLEQFPLDWRAKDIFEKLVLLPDLGSHAPRLATLAIAWLEQCQQTKSVKSLIDILLEQPRLSDPDWTRVSKIAVAWLRRRAVFANREKSLAGLLMRPQLLDAGNLAWTKKQAKHWLNNSPKDAQDTHGLRAALDGLRIKEESVAQ